MHIQQKSLRKILGWLTLATTLVILYLGLWPYNIGSTAALFWTASDGHRLTLLPPNEVQWLKDEAGLHFGQHGSIFSAADFTTKATDAVNCTFEVWLEPAATADFATALGFSKRENPLQFRVRQVEDSLSVSRNWLDEQRQPQTETIWVDHAFHYKQRVLIAVSSGSEGTAVYLNGKLRQNYPQFKLKATDFTGRFVFGNSPRGHETWTGDLRGLAIFPSAMSAETAREHYEIWKSGADFSPATTVSASALYRLTEGAGNLTRSAAAGAPDLLIPSTFRTMQPVLLEPFWKEYENNTDHWVDIFLNIVGFVPLGFLLRGYLEKGLDAAHPIRKTLALGFVLSLGIEVGQYFLPMRHSGTTDLITNTTGTLIGALLFGTRPVRRAMRNLVPKRKGDHRVGRRTSDEASIAVQRHG